MFGIAIKHFDAPSQLVSVNNLVGWKLNIGADEDELCFEPSAFIKFLDENELDPSPGLLELDFSGSNLPVVIADRAKFEEVEKFSSVNNFAIVTDWIVLFHSADNALDIRNEEYSNNKPIDKIPCIAADGLCLDASLFRPFNAF